MARSLSLLLATPHPLEATANPVNGYLRRLAAALRRAGHRALLVGPTADGERAAADEQAIREKAVGWEDGEVAVGEPSLAAGGGLAGLPTRGSADLLQTLFLSL